MYRMEKFSDFILEQKEEPYTLLLLVHSTPDDPNKTGVILEKESKLFSSIQFFDCKINRVLAIGSIFKDTSFTVEWHL